MSSLESLSFLLRQSPGCLSRRLSGLLNQCSAEMDEAGARGLQWGRQGPWGCFGADVGSKGLRLLRVVPPHPPPYSQFPAHRLFLFCCELQFPWVPH